MTTDVRAWLQVAGVIHAADLIHCVETETAPFGFAFLGPGSSAPSTRDR